MYIKKIFIIIITMIFFVLLSACDGNIGNKNENKIKVITTLYPQYDFVRQIGKENVEVTLLLPPGVEAHSYQPTPQDIIDIHNADLFIFTGEYNEPWAHDLIENLQNSDVLIIDLSVGITLIEGGHEEEQPETEEEHGNYDPHIWLSPLNAIIMMDSVLNALVSIDPQNSDFYTTNATNYKNEIQALDQAFVDLFNKYGNDTIIYGGHNAFGYFEARYGVHFESPYEGFSPDAEPTAEDILRLINLMRDNKQYVIYFEELLEPRVANRIAAEVERLDNKEVNLLLLHGVHNVTDEEIKKEVTYVSLMKDNLNQLEIGFTYTGEELENNNIDTIIYIAAGASIVLILSVLGYIYFKKPRE